jgi:hypothetical protein
LRLSTYRVKTSHGRRFRRGTHCVMTPVEFMARSPSVVAELEVGGRLRPRRGSGGSRKEGLPLTSQKLKSYAEVTRFEIEQPASPPAEGESKAVD